jgi:hypothetical protein
MFAYLALQPLLRNLIWLVFPRLRLLFFMVISVHCQPFDAGCDLNLHRPSRVSKTMCRETRPKR